MLRAVALATVAVVGGMSTAPQGGQQSVQPVASPEAAAVGPCASTAYGIADQWCTQTCTQGDGSACNLQVCVCGAEAEAELAKPTADRAISNGAAGTTPAPAPKPNADPRAETGIQPETPATTPVPFQTPIPIRLPGDPGLPTENVCDFDVVACINTTTDEMVPCLGWEERHPEASPAPSARGLRLGQTGVQPAKPARRGWPLDPAAPCDEKTGKPTNGSVSDCRSCQKHIQWCYESAHFDENDRPVAMSLEECMDEVGKRAMECGPAGCRHACSVCSSKESKMVYKAMLGLDMKEPAPLSPVSEAVADKVNAADATENAEKAAKAKAANAERQAQEAQAAAAASQQAQATGAAQGAAEKAAEEAAARAKAAEEAQAAAAAKAAEGAQAAMEKAADVGTPAHQMWRRAARAALDNIW